MRFTACFMFLKGKHVNVHHLHQLAFVLQMASLKKSLHTNQFLGIIKERKKRIDFKIIRSWNDTRSSLVRFHHELFCPGTTPRPDGPSGRFPSHPLIRIISEHCHHHPYSSHWPLAGDGESFCCSTCGRPAAPAQGSTDMLRILPELRPTQAGRGERTSPETTTTYCCLCCCCCCITRLYQQTVELKVKAVIQISADPALRRRSHYCTGDAREESQVLSVQKAGAACGFFILQLLL